MTGAPESATEIPREDRLVLNTTTTLHALGPSVSRVGPGVGAVLKLVTGLPLRRLRRARSLARDYIRSPFSHRSVSPLGVTTAVLHCDDRLTRVIDKWSARCSSSSTSISLQPEHEDENGVATPNRKESS